MSGHSGRCFRQWRRTKARKLAQGHNWDYPIRQKVPQALRPFLVGDQRQMRAGAEAMAVAVMRYAQHQTTNRVQRGAARGR